MKQDYTVFVTGPAYLKITWPIFLNMTGTSLGSVSYGSLPAATSVLRRWYFSLAQLQAGLGREKGGRKMARPAGVEPTTHCLEVSP